MKSTARLPRKKGGIVKSNLVPLINPSFIDDASADASISGGVAPVGAQYYNTTSNVLKIKTNAGWLTVTAS